MNRWWQGKSSERFWMELTDRSDIGADLNAPMYNESGEPQWSYDLLREPLDGDLVFHYSQPKKAIIGYSFVTGDAWPDSVVWGAKGSSATAKGVEPYVREGYRRGLTGLTFLQQPVDLEMVRSRETEILALRQALEEEHGRPIYFPFVPYRGKQIRTYQGYMLKFPGALVELLGLPKPSFSAMAESGAQFNSADQMIGEGLTIESGGGAYRPQDEDAAVSRSTPMSVDPGIMERGLRGHRRTQNLLASWLAERGQIPLSPLSGDPDWDVAWRHGDKLFVCEVKSLTSKNEERQLRLGLGQVLRYRQKVGGNSVAVLAVEQEPLDPTWLELCEALGVHICWPGAWDRLPGAGN